MPGDNPWTPISGAGWRKVQRKAGNSCKLYGDMYCEYVWFEINFRVTQIRFITITRFYVFNRDVLYHTHNNYCVVIQSQEVKQCTDIKYVEKTAVMLHVKCTPYNGCKMKSIILCDGHPGAFVWLVLMLEHNDDVIKWKHFPRYWPFVREITGPGELPAQRPVTRSFDVFFDLRLNKRLSKQPWGWWFEMPSWWLWRQCNEMVDVLWTIFSNAFCLMKIITYSFKLHWIMFPMSLLMTSQH